MKAVAFVPILAAGLLLCAVPAPAQTSGSIEGRVTGPGGQGLPGVEVTVEGIDGSTVTAADGSFRFAEVPAGTYTLLFTSGESSTSRGGVEVTAGATATVDLAVDWQPRFLEAINVVSVSRRAERITEAPAAVTLVPEEQIQREASHGQLPKLLEFTPGAEVTQSGIYDFNFNTRGFNSSLNRRVVNLIDGRDPSVPFLGAQEWAAISFPLDDLASLELIRGPSAALYGANASSGVLNMITKAPKVSQGGELRLAGGELSTGNADFRWAGELGSEWYAKVVGGYRSSGDFSKSRVTEAEYTELCPPGVSGDCLPREATPLVLVNDNEISFGGLRLDKYIGQSVLTVEGGYADIQGPVFQTGIGRVQLTDVQRPWARFNFGNPHFNVLAYWNGRDADDQRALASNTPLYLDSENYNIELQGNVDFAGGRGRLVGGVSYSEEDIDTANPQGQQTLVFEPISSDFQAVFAQLDFDLSDRLRLVLAGRWDDSSLHDSQVSPKASLVFAAAPNHTLRLSYNEAFQVPNYSEYFLNANAAPPVNLQPFEGFCAAAGISCGFAPGPTRVLALGNEDLEVEEVKSAEVGYSGILGGKAYLTVDYYRSRNENFITDLLPQLGTPLGRINPNFGPYTPPAELPAPLQAALLATLQASLPPQVLAILSNNPDGTPILAAASYTNFGRVDTQGVDLGLNIYGHGGWRYQFSYSWFDFDVKEEIGQGFDPLLPNSPEHKANGAVSYVGESFDASVAVRWSDTFRWAVGPFQGDVKSYTVVDLVGNYHINDSWSLGLNVANLLDEKHWEAFGGDVLGRRALVSTAFRW